MKLILLMLLTYISCYGQEKNTPVPGSSRQMILVLTDSVQSSNGFLFRYERSDADSKWEIDGDSIPVVLGRNGLAWGRGLSQADDKLPLKKEGDGKSPAGVFKLSYVFGFAPADSMKKLKISYIPLIELTECVDDIKSEHYNQVREKDSLSDWSSSEKMFREDPWYRQGIIVDQNSDPVVKGSGSCIFLHNWADPGETTAGCTELEPKTLGNIIHWLDSSFHPILVQLTRELYSDYRTKWELP